MIRDYLVANTRPVANPKNVFNVGKMRFTVLTPTLLRVEVSNKGRFSDEATQIVWFRDMPECNYTYVDDLGGVEITTDEATFFYCKANKRVTKVAINHIEIPCDNVDNLKGTARTLDMKTDNVELQNGIIGRRGVAYFDDNSLLLGEDGKLMPRDEGRLDSYVFASQDYRKSLRAYFEITGYPPMVPRYALGNWWSRYHAYTQAEYLELMERFKGEKLPFSVATVDMDWHWVNIRKKFGWKYLFTRGWTGYSWNTQLFPDYKAFLKKLQEMGLRTSLNLHPAKGVRSYEVQYKDMCKALGTNVDSGKAIKFDLTDDDFLNAYFEILHHPYEEDGVDVWWIDWQQGSKSKLAGLDPLWALNHYHYLSAGRSGKRPLILSRYAGLGSHRYPLGFSGDTIITWKSLKFQTYFTNTAANCGYFSWSHDIGGHTFGDQKDNELYIRWLQYGVFSPILRLHSTKIGIGKEPWNFPEVEKEAGEALRLRMKLVPYIYNAYFKAFSEGAPICEPLYYRHKAEPAFTYTNEYYFGENLLVVPITEKRKKGSNMSVIEAYIPDGAYTDIFTLERVMGGGMVRLERGIDSIPVLAKDGTILPLNTDVSGNTENPKEMELRVYSGDGAYSLYEDDGLTDDYAKGDYAITEFTVTKNGGYVALTKQKVQGNVGVIPEKRSFKIKFVNETDYIVKAFLNGEEIDVKKDKEDYVTIKDTAPSDALVVIAYSSEKERERAESAIAKAQAEAAEAAKKMAEEGLSVQLPVAEVIKNQEPTADEPDMESLVGTVEDLINNKE